MSRIHMRAGLAVLIYVLGLALLGLTSAYGQSVITIILQEQKRRELQQQEFDRRQRAAKVKVRQSKPRASPFSRAAPAVAETMPDVPPSTFVHVIGDSLADLLADGLATQLQDRPDVAVERHIKASSGLVRDDFYDWRGAVDELVASGTKIDAAVIMLGANDRQEFRGDESALELRSDAWRDAYVKRVDAILTALKTRKVPIFWVGLPPMRSQRLNADIVWFNEIFRERTEAAGGTYVDIWDSFVDEDGQYAASGPDLNGQITKLRLGDGVHFSKAGAQVAAHYVERELRRTLQAPPVVAGPAPAPIAPDEQDAEEPPLDTALQSTTAEPVEPPKPEYGPVQPLDPVENAVGGVPLGGPPATTSRVAGASPALPAVPVGAPADPSAARVLVHGEALPAKEGRADDFRWPPRPARDPVLTTSSRPPSPATAMP